MSDTLSVCALTICRGSKLRTMLPVPGTEIEIPLTIINGAFDGPTLLVTAGIHGGEYPGIAAAMELGRSLDPQEIHGSLIMLFTPLIYRASGRAANLSCRKTAKT